MSIYNLDALLRPEAVVSIGEPHEAAAAQMLANLRASSGLQLLETDSALARWPQRAQRIAAVIANASLASAGLVARLGERGCRALLWPLSEPPPVELLVQTRAHRMRLLGPRSGGVVNTGSALNAAAFPCAPLAGGLALIAQSQSIVAAALDWAAGRKLGFSWVAVSGGEADVDIADLLDYAALDPHTQGVAVQLSCIHGARKFMSAARACARLKPVVVLQTQPAPEPGQGADRVRSAAFARAGMVECESLPGLFDAIAALQRLPVLQQPSALVAGNGAGICILGVDALARQGLSPFALGAALRASLCRHLPQLRIAGGALDFGKLDAVTLADVVRELLADAGLPALLLLHSPLAGAPHAAAAEALAALPPDPRLLTVWLGLQSALDARAHCAQAGIATFTSPDAAARALRYRWQYHHNRELLTQTPPPDRLPGVNLRAQRAQLQRRAGAGVEELARADLRRLLKAYGVEPVAATRAGVELELRIATHAEMGQHLLLAAPGSGRPAACAFVPLDALLAGRLLDEAGVTADAPTRAHLAEDLIHVGQLLMDQPQIGALRLQMCADADGAGWRAGAQLRLAAAPPAERQRLALAPYPSELNEIHETAQGRRYRLRAVRPADEPALIGLLERLDPEEVRMRFFLSIRHFSHAMGARMTQIDYDRELSLVVVPAEGSLDEVIGIATLIADADGRSAEFALVVHHDHARQGLGRHLLQRLVEHAARRGIGSVHGVVLSENAAMLATARRLGFSRRPDPDEPGCMRVEITPA